MSKLDMILFIFLFLFPFLESFGRYLGLKCIANKKSVTEVCKSDKNIGILGFEIHLYRPYNMTKDIPDYKLLFH